MAYQIGDYNMTIKLSDLGGGGGGGTALGEITRLFPNFQDDYERDGQKFLRSGFAITSGWDASLDPFIFPAGVWTAVTSGFGSAQIRSVATDQAGVWVAVGNSGTMTRSTNNGATWSGVTSGFGSTQILSVATDQAGVWVAVGDSGTMTRADGLTFGIDTGNDVDYVRYL